MTSRRAASAAPPPASPGVSHQREPAYASLMRQRVGLLALSALLLGITLIADILIGPAFLSVIDVLSALFAPAAAERTVAVIVYDIRLPMTLMAMLVGASLGVAGAAMQTILGNPLASPYTLGVSAAAGFGAALVILTGFALPGLPVLTVPIAAFIAAGSASALVYGLCTPARHEPGGDGARRDRHAVSFPVPTIPSAISRLTGGAAGKWCSGCSARC